MSLDPAIPSLSSAQQLARRMQVVQNRIDALRRSRPRPSIGDGPPTGAAQNGIYYFDQIGKRPYHYTPEGWKALDLFRVYAANLSYTGANIGTGWENFGSPQVTIEVPDEGRFVALYAKANIYMDEDAIADLGFGGSEITTPPSVDRVSQLGNNPVYTMPNEDGFPDQKRDSSNPILFAATPGTRTYGLRFRCDVAGAAIYGLRELWGWLV